MLAIWTQGAVGVTGDPRGSLEYATVLHRDRTPRVLIGMAMESKFFLQPPRAEPGPVEFLFTHLHSVPTQDAFKLTTVTSFN